MGFKPGNAPIVFPQFFREFFQRFAYALHVIGEFNDFFNCGDGFADSAQCINPAMGALLAPRKTGDWSGIRRAASPLYGRPYIIVF